MTAITREQTVDIGYGRGRLAPEPAASIARIDAQLGRPADINSAWRDPVLQQQLWEAWEAYRTGRGPAAPLALPPDKSVHCAGYAVDSDDWYNAAAAAVWRDNGWRQTARYPDDPKRDEPWHGEYFPQFDNHRNTTASDGAQPFPTPTPEGEDDDMGKIYSCGAAYMIIGPKTFLELGDALTKRTGVDGTETLALYRKLGWPEVKLNRRDFDVLRINTRAAQ